MISAKSVARQLTWPVDIITVAEGRDEVGDPTETTTTKRVCGKWAPAQSIDEVGAENWANAELDLYLPAHTAITSSCRVSIPSGFHAGLWEVAAVRNWHVGIVARIRRAT